MITFFTVVSNPISLYSLIFNASKDIQNTWAGLNRLAANDKDPMLKRIRRDGHCHEAVMWYGHIDDFYR